MGEQKGYEPQSTHRIQDEDGVVPWGTLGAPKKQGDDGENDTGDKPQDDSAGWKPQRDSAGWSSHYWKDDKWSLCGDSTASHSWKDDRWSLGGDSAASDTWQDGGDKWGKKKWSEFQ